MWPQMGRTLLTGVPWWNSGRCCHGLYGGMWDIADKCFGGGMPPALLKVPLCSAGTWCSVTTAGLAETQGGAGVSAPKSMGLENHKPFITPTLEPFLSVTVRVSHSHRAPRPEGITGLMLEEPDCSRG